MNIEFLKTKGPSAISRVLGISRQTVANYIKGDSCMSADQALALARYYGVPLSAVVDPNYREAKQEDLLAALDAENRRLLAKLNTVKHLLSGVKVDVESIIANIEPCTKQEG